MSVWTAPVKFQESIGTVDEKIPYALEDLKAFPMAGCIAYAGGGFSDGVLHMLEASLHAAYCMPTLDQSEPSPETCELDHLMAMHFEWWDVLVGGKRPGIRPATSAFLILASRRWWIAEHKGDS
jgi:hypothetical protein